uniref:Uncharacterized protein n=1 Tax=Cajanus cajan TaxID=3821 RepID=A0A151TIQ4_CAJCA|nr:hypothetical protein KK1_013177 [Cajanus cajan]
MVKEPARKNLRYFFSTNVGWQVCEKMTNEIGFLMTNNLDKYFCVPLFHDCPSKGTF